MPFAASPYLHCDEASQMEMPLHHGKPSQKVFTLGAKVWKFPSQECEPKNKRQ